MQVESLHTSAHLLRSAQSDALYEGRKEPIMAEQKPYCKVELTSINYGEKVIIVRPTDDPGYPFVYKDTVRVPKDKKRGMQRKLLNLFNNHPEMLDWVESSRLLEAAALPAFRDGYFKSSDSSGYIDEAIIRWCQDNGYLDDEDDEDDEDWDDDEEDE